MTRCAHDVSAVAGPSYSGQIPRVSFHWIAMRLLLVEDSEKLRRFIATGLRSAGYAVDLSADGAEALWYARGNDYDAIILDLMLPGVDGLHVLRTLREEGRDTHILVLTARDT